MALTIYPYLIGDVWVFDDERTGLKEEAFVLGMSEMISSVVKAKNIPNAPNGFSLTFADEPFDGHDIELNWVRSDDSQFVPGQARTLAQLFGNWYRGTIAGQVMDGWLCPALELYFSGAPARLFVGADRLPPGVDPIWHVDPKDLRQRRFVSADGAE